VQQTSHTVSVTWTASVSTDVVGYNVYRGTVSGGPYSILDSTPVTADAYSDSTVQGGQTFYYVVRSVDNTGIESVNSTEVQAIIP
jgi:fibronectin type 3 domain-containing protein